MDHKTHNIHEPRIEQWKNENIGLEHFFEKRIQMSTVENLQENPLSIQN